MQWAVPRVAEWRDLPEDSTGQATLHHTRGLDDFCLHCGHDLRVPMLIVSAVRYSDVWRRRLCQAALFAEYDIDQEFLAGFTLDDRKNLKQLCKQAYRVSLKHSCGPDDIEFVGVTTDGICLFAVEGKYEIANQIRLWYERSHEQTRLMQIQEDEIRAIGKKALSADVEFPW